MDGGKKTHTLKMPNYPKRSHGVYQCSRHRTVAHAEPCNSSVRCATLDEFVSAKLLEALQPAGADLSMQVIENEVARREQLDTLYAQRVEQTRYTVELAERRYKEVDPSNRLVAGTLEREWERALAELQTARSELDELRNTQPTKLSDTERQKLKRACADISRLWQERATVEQRKQIVRLLLRAVEVDVHNNTDRVTVRIHWSGGFESCHQITRSVMRFDQMESYDQLVERTLGLALSGERSPKIAAILEEEGFRSPRSDKPISASMVQKLLIEDPPPLATGHWRSADLARELGVSEKRLKDWVTRGWATAIQRPFGRTWVIYADEQELQRLQRLASSQTGQGRPGPSQELRTPASIPPTNTAVN